MEARARASRCHRDHGAAVACADSSVGALLSAERHSANAAATSGSNCVPAPAAISASASASRKCRSVTPRHKRLEDIAYGEHARRQRYGGATEPVGIALAVPAFVVMAHDHAHTTEAGRGDDAGRQVRVPLEPVTLVGGERSGASQQLGIDTDLADVVQQRRRAAGSAPPRPACRATWPDRPRAQRRLGSALR